MKDLKFEIKRKIAVLSESEHGNFTKEVNLLSWNGAPPQLDIRMWRRQQDGTKKPLKGITLGSSEVEQLKAALESLEGLGD